MKTNVIIRFNTRNIRTVKIILFAWISVHLAGCSNRTDFITTSTGLQYKIIEVGSGLTVRKGQEVIIHETTTYPNGMLVYTSRDSPDPIKIRVGENQVIQGVDEGVLGMKKGEVRKLIVPPSLSKRTVDVAFPHPDSTLVYEIELIDILADTTTKDNDVIITIDKENSMLKWEGFNKLHTNGHYGTVAFHKGEFYEKEKQLIGGEFVIDMSTIINTDGPYSKGLVDHLKNSDFFDVEKYPTAKLVIQNIDHIDATNISIIADLTIKDSTQSIGFDAQITYNDKKMIFASRFEIDRTRWGIMYASDIFFNNLADNLISDIIKFEVNIVAQ